MYYNTTLVQQALKFGRKSFFFLLLWNAKTPQKKRSADWHVSQRIVNAKFQLSNPLVELIPTNQPTKLQVALRKCSFKQTAEKILLSAAAAIHLPENWIQGITSFPAWNDISFLTWIFCFWERFWVRSHLAPAEPDLKFPLWSSTGTTKPLSPTSSFQEPAPKSLSFTPKKLDCNVKQILNVPHSYFHSLTSYF